MVASTLSNDFKAALYTIAKLLQLSVLLCSGQVSQHIKSRSPGYKIIHRHTKTHTLTNNYVTVRLNQPCVITDESSILTFVNPSSVYMFKIHLSI